MIRQSIFVVLAISATAQLWAQAPKVGPAKGTVFAVGGGAGPDLLAKFIEAAGGPDALILDVPTASYAGAQTEGQFGPGAGRPVDILAKWKAAGARNVQVLHTTDRKVADSDSFVEPITKARGVWFDGGLPERISGAYARTKTDEEFRKVLERGGVVGGTSAGAVVLGNIFEANGGITAEGFGLLHGVIIQPHARIPMPDYMSKYAELERLAMPEVTALVIRGDIADVVGTGEAFVYRDDPGDPAKRVITLRAGDRYNLATHEVHRSTVGSQLTEQFVDSLFADFAKADSPAATILVAQEGRILIDKSYNIPPSAQDIPTTVSPTFTLGGLTDAFNAVAVQVLADESKLSLDAMNLERAELARLIDKNSALPHPLARTSHDEFFRLRILGAVGSLMSPDRIRGDIMTGEFVGSVDPLYTWSVIRLQYPAIFGTNKALDPTFGWQKDRYHGLNRLSLFGSADRKRHVFVRIPEKEITVIILTNKQDADARSIAERITDRLLQ
jgi:cyanophycinase